jgi:uncharacterized protein YggU (UPF0235/DUF167 family)
VLSALTDVKRDIRNRRLAPVGDQMAKDSLAKGAWAQMAVTGTRLAVHVTPNARHNTLTCNTLTNGEADLRCTVTATPEDGKANHAVIVLLAHALGVARSRLILTHGATSRDKVFRLD